MTDVKRLYVFLVGYEILPRAVSLRGVDERFMLASTVCAYLLETARGFVLIDSGINTATLASDAARARFYPRPLWPAPPIVLPAHELLPQLAALAIEPGDIDHVILSHSHCDHTGNLRAFGGAQIHIQKAEYAYAMGPHGNYAVFDGDLGGDLDWRLHEGDWTLMPGVEAVLSAGHMPGHQSVLVSLPDAGPKLLVIDAGDLQENFDREILPGECIGGDAAALASIRRLKALARERGAEIVLLHDARAVEAMRLAPAFYA